MNKSICFALLLSLSLPLSAQAGRSVVSLANPDSLDGSIIWDNTLVDGTVIQNKCRTTVSINSHGAPGLRGMDIVCLFTQDSVIDTRPTNYKGSSTVLRGTADATKGNLVMKADGRSIDCGLTTPSLSINQTVTCYEDTGWTPATRCMEEGGFWIPANSLPVTKKYRKGNLLGVCSLMPAGSGMTPPDGTLLAQTGYSVPCKKCPPVTCKKCP